MYVSIDQLLIIPFRPNSASQCRRVTVGDRPIASPTIRFPRRVMRSTDVVSLPRTASKPYVSVRAHEAKRTSVAVAKGRKGTRVFIAGPYAATDRVVSCQ